MAKNDEKKHEIHIIGERVTEEKHEDHTHTGMKLEVKVAGNPAILRECIARAMLSDKNFKEIIFGALAEYTINK